MWIFFVVKRFDRFKGVLRAAAVLAFFSLVFTFAGARHARAELARTSTRIGRDLLPIADLLAGGTSLTLNGEKMLLRYDGSTKGVREVLDAAEEACRNGDVKGNVMGRLVDMGVLRGGDDEEGVVLCFARGEGTPDSLRAQVERLKQTKDLGSLGKMRYVYAKKERGGSAVLAAITEDSFRLDAFRAGTTGDAPGSDDPALPRPKDGVRAFSAVLEGTPYAARVYRTRANEDDVKATYIAEMAARGFTAIEAKTKDGRASIGFQRDGVMVIVATAKDRDGTLLVSVGTIGVDPLREAHARTSSG